MTSVRRDLRDDGVRAGARERTRRRAQWLSAARARRSGTSSAARGRSRARRSTSSTRRPARSLAQVTQGTKRGRRRRGRRRRARRYPAWQALDGHARARYLYALARAVQKQLAPARGAGERWTTASRSARRATSTSRSSRGTSIITPAGRSCSRREFPGYEGGRRRRADHSVELPAADAGVEGRAGARGGKHGRASSRPSSRRSPRCCFAELARRGGAAGRRAQHRHRRRRHGRRDRRRTRTSTRSRSPGRPKSAASSARRRRAAARSSRSSWAERARSSCTTTPTSTSVVEGVVDAIWFNQGQVCCAGSRLLVQEGVAERLDREAARAHGEAARRLAARQGGRHGRDRGAGAARAHPGAGGSRGQDEGATMWQPSWACPTEGCFYPPTLFTDVQPSSTIAQVEIFGPVLVSMTFRTPEESVALANNTPYGLAASVWTREHQPRARHRAEDQGGRGVDQLDEPVRRGGRIRRLPRERVRARGRTRGDVGVPRSRPSSETDDLAAGRAARAARSRSRRRRGRALRRAAELDDADRGAPLDRSHAEAVHRRQAGAPRLRLLAPHHRRRRARRSAKSARAIARTSATRSKPRTRRRGLGEGDGAHIARRSSTTSPRTCRRARDEFARAHRCDDRRSSASAREVDATRPAAVHLRGVGRQVRRRGAQRADPRRRARDERADRRRRPRVPRGASRCSASSRSSRRRSRPATRSSRFRRERASARRDGLLQVLETSDVPGGVINIVTGATRRAREGAGRARRRRGDVVLRVAARA